MGRAIGSRNGYRTCRVCRGVKPLSEFKEPVTLSICLGCPRDYKGEYARMKASPNHKDRVAKAKRKQYYGITQEQYDEMLASQNGVCAICKLATRLVVDHDHDTGEFRGLLCRTCNSGIGQLRDSLRLVLAAADYLGKRNYPRSGFVSIEGGR